MPRSAWFVLPLAGALLLAGCAVPPKQAPAPPAPPTAPAPPPEAAPAAPPPGAMSDQQFVDLALSAGAMQIGIGRLAHGKAASHAVRTLGARLIAEYSYQNLRLTLLARHLKITPAPPLDKPPPELLITNGSDFDLEFLPIEVQALQQLGDLFEAAAGAGQDPRIKYFAHETVPVVQHQLRDVRAVELTASR